MIKKIIIVVLIIIAAYFVYSMFFASPKNSEVKEVEKQKPCSCEEVEENLEVINLVV